LSTLALSAGALVVAPLALLVGYILVIVAAKGWLLRRDKTKAVAATAAAEAAAAVHPTRAEHWWSM